VCGHAGFAAELKGDLPERGALGEVEDDVAGEGRGLDVLADAVDDHELLVDGDLDGGCGRVGEPVALGVAVCGRSREAEHAATWGRRRCGCGGGGRGSLERVGEGGREGVVCGLGYLAGG
jgi:hypothetical protein